MNPIDKAEFLEFCKIIHKDMPLHTENHFQMKRNFDQGMPKNLMEYSRKLDNEFLNPNLGIIEEIQHRDPTNIIPKWFREYQKRIYGDSDILNHDNFFKAKLHDSFFKYHDEFGMPKNTKYYKPLSIQNVAFLAPKKVNGADITVGSTALTSNGWNSLIIGGRKTTGVAGQYYDQIALNVTSASGNERLAVYSDNGSGTQPDTLQAEVGSTVSVNGYNWRSVTEFALLTNTVYIVMQASSSTNTTYYQSLQNQVYVSPFTYGAYPAGSSLSYSASGNTPMIKTGHS